MQVHVDDPILIAAGSRLTKKRRKGQKGQTVEWIGGEFSLLQDGVLVQLAEAKSQAAQNSIDEIHQCHATWPVKKISVVHRIHVVDCFRDLFVSMLRENTHGSYPVDTEKHDRSEKFVFVKCIHFGLCCLGQVHFGERSL